ncbi:MAG: LysR family transcriptional regulator [Maritimibacter sp.]|jgi:DNA-binding transcriptional LysR family regulator
MIDADWDDIRFVLAVAREGTLSGAARLLGVNHATVLRRVNGFENRLGVTVFDRTARGYRLAPHRENLLNAMQDMETASLGVDRALVAARTALFGTVRVTSTDTMCLSLLPRLTRQIMRAAEGLSIELITNNDLSDLGRMEADIAVRFNPSPDDDLVGRSAGTAGYAVFSGPGGTDKWLGMSGALLRSKAAKWMAENIDPAQITAHAGSFPVLMEMVAEGHGRAILPVMLAAHDPRLERVPYDLPNLDADVWVVSHADLAEVPRIKAVRDMLADALLAELE